MEDIQYYKYEMLGGNHSRQAYQALLQQPMYRLRLDIQKRPTIVYANLTDEALTVGKSHNMAAETHLPTKFQDDVKLARRLLHNQIQGEFPEEEHVQGGEKFTSTLKDVFQLTVINLGQ